MKKLAIVVLSELSSGEMTIGYEFGSRLPRDEYEVQYIVPTKYVAYLEDKQERYLALSVQDGPFANRQLIDQFIKTFQPDYFLLSDVFTTEYAKAWSGMGMKGFKEYGIPVIGVDEYEYLTAGYKPDYYGGLFEQLPNLLTACDYVLRDCPLNLPKAGQPEHVRYFSLYRDHLERSAESKANIKRGLGLAPGEKLLFFVSSSWETINFHKTPSLANLMKWLPIMLQHYIKSLSGPVAVLHVGPGAWTEGFAGSQVRYLHYPYLSPTEFDDCLLSSDLFITTNIVSITLSKAVYGAVPSIVFQNHKFIDFSKLHDGEPVLPEWYQEMAAGLRSVYPFRAGYFGWFELLKKVLDGNVYTDTFVQLPLFKHREVLEQLERYLYDEASIRQLQAAQRAYIQEILKLTTPAEVMASIPMASIKQT